MEISTSEITSDLYHRIQKEADKIINEQLNILGIIQEPGKLKRILYPDDPDTFCSYEYDGIKILGVRRKVGEYVVSIEFDIPNLIEKETPGGSHDKKNIESGV